MGDTKNLENQQQLFRQPTNRTAARKRRADPPKQMVTLPNGRVNGRLSNCCTAGTEPRSPRAAHRRLEPWQQDGRRSTDWPACRHRRTGTGSNGTTAQQPQRLRRTAPRRRCSRAAGVNLGQLHGCGCVSGSAAPVNTGHRSPNKVWDASAKVRRAGHRVRGDGNAVTGPASQGRRLFSLNGEPTKKPPHFYVQAVVVSSPAQRAQRARRARRGCSRRQRRPGRRSWCQAAIRDRQAQPTGPG